jgi:hypothetical protein
MRMSNTGGEVSAVQERMILEGSDPWRRGAAAPESSKCRIDVVP